MIEVVVGYFSKIEENSILFFFGYIVFGKIVFYELINVG